MSKKEKHIKLKKVVMGEAIALLLVVNAVLVIRLDKTCQLEVSKTGIMSQGKKIDTAKEEQEAQKQTEAQNEIQTQTAARVEAPGTSELQKEAVKVAKTVDSKLLILVNKDNKVPNDYKVSLVTYKETGKKIAKSIHDPLKEMLSDGIKQGLSFRICSAYRSNELQKTLFDRDKRKFMREGKSEQEAEEETAKSVQPSGYSEHVTGLAVDIVSKKNSNLNSSQEETKEFKWLKENCSKYGFILRYPDGKTDITGIIYEPWHFRYVGEEVAQFIMNNNLTYEEFYTMIHHE